MCKKPSNANKKFDCITPIERCQYHILPMFPVNSVNSCLLLQYAAAAAALAGPGTSPLLLCHPQYSLALAALHHDRLSSKNSSIADLRLKAKRHAEAIEMHHKESV